jgi:hypothetical protein
VPEDYPAEGGYWFVSYSAGSFDTTNWVMNYSAQGKEAADTQIVRLID